MIKKFQETILFKQISELVNGFDLILLQLVESSRPSGLILDISLTTKDHSILKLSQLEEVHHLILSRTEVLLNRDDIRLELSSAGINRVLKNDYEIEVFQNKDCELFYNGRYRVVKIEKINKELEKIDFIFKDNQESITIDYMDIKKLRLNFDDKEL